MGKNINEYQALMSFIKGNIGTGILSMPVVFKYAGLWFLIYFFPRLNTNIYLVGFVVCLVLIVMNFKSSMRVVTYLSALANICTIVGMLLIFGYLFTSGLYPVSKFPIITDFKGLLIAFSIVMFSFEGISLVSGIGVIIIIIMPLLDDLVFLLQVDCSLQVCTCSQADDQEEGFTCFWKCVGRLLLPSCLHCGS
ncbi:unnamed protein product [Trichobilharzia regenti]|nr:unnamed protein product [Trichobilharzia regenti]